jgi:hypothetical protein
MDAGQLASSQSRTSLRKLSNSLIGFPRSSYWFVFDRAILVLLLAHSSYFGLTRKVMERGLKQPIEGWQLRKKQQVLSQIDLGLTLFRQIPKLKRQLISETGTWLADQGAE